MRTEIQLVMVMAVVAVAASAFGLTIDLVDPGAAPGSIGDAFFTTSPLGGTGSGSIDSFVRYQDASSLVTHGYNTDAGNPYEYDQKHGSFTHSIQLGSIPIVDGAREFMFDINETGSAAWLSLDQVEIWVASSGSLVNHAVGWASVATKVYDMDGAGFGNSWVELSDREAGMGSGKADMFMYVDNSVFAGYGNNAFIYLYSRSGEQPGEWANSDGFEEWAVEEAYFDVPEGGATLTLIGLSCIGLAVPGRLFKRRQLT